MNYVKMAGPKLDFYKRHLNSGRNVLLQFKNEIILNQNVKCEQFETKTHQRNVNFGPLILVITQRVK